MSSDHLPARPSRPPEPVTPEPAERPVAPPPAASAKDRARARAVRAAKAQRRRASAPTAGPSAREQRLARKRAEEVPAWAHVGTESTPRGDVEVHYAIKANGKVDHRVRRLVHPDGTAEVINLHQEVKEASSAPFSLPRAQEWFNQHARRDQRQDTGGDGGRELTEREKVLMSLRRGMV